MTEFVRAADAAGELDIADAKLAANDLWSLILSGPRDHYLHHMNERPTDAKLCDAIGHGLAIFLKAYSCNPTEDQEALQRKIAAKQQQVAEQGSSAP